DIVRFVLDDGSQGLGASPQVAESILDALREAPNLLANPGAAQAKGPAVRMSATPSAARAAAGARLGGRGRAGTVIASAASVDDDHVPVGFDEAERVAARQAVAVLAERIATQAKVVERAMVEVGLKEAIGARVEAASA